VDLCERYHVLNLKQESRQVADYKLSPDHVASPPPGTQQKSKEKTVRFPWTIISVCKKHHAHRRAGIKELSIEARDLLEQR
jgi:hypothetical protein